MKNSKRFILCAATLILQPVMVSNQAMLIALNNAEYRLPPATWHTWQPHLKKLFTQIKTGKKPATFKYGNIRLILHLNAPIQNAKTQCIVNAANGGIFGKDGVAKFIQDKVDKKKWNNYVASVHGALNHLSATTQLQTLPSGAVLLMPAYYPDKSAIKQIIHAVGPRASEEFVAQKLYHAYLTALQLAAERDISSITFPLLSAGIFGVSDPDFNGRLNPIKPAIVAINEFAAHNQHTPLKEIHFTLFPVKGGPDWYHLFIDALNNLPEEK